MSIYLVWNVVAALILAIGVATPGRARTNEHYATSHPVGAYATDKIEGMINKGMCQEIRAYSCPAVKKAYWLCAPAGSPMMKVNGSSYLVWVGVILGMRTDPPVKITGFAANWFYWQNALAKDGCREYVRLGSAR